MMSVLNKGNVPVKIWSPIEEVESGALDQLTNIANLPCVFKHVAVMPDVHLGKGATVGSVIATKAAIIPAAVGVDIGCGMMAALLPLKANQLPDSLSGIRSDIEGRIPVGHNSRQDTEHISTDVFQELFYNFDYLHQSVWDLCDKAQRQLGTLGGGNHFIELCLDEFENVWVMLHSGSRNIGKSLAEAHIDTAKDLMRKYFMNLADPDLAYLVEGTPEFEKYWKDLQWAQRYAELNRVFMMADVLNVLRTSLKLDLPVSTIVNCHHNYAEREHHYGSNVIVTRKGAVRARRGDLGIIPGSMGTRSYIVRGLGNEDSFCSCSHGAGRRMSRGKAKANFTQADLEAQTAGVECRKDTGVLDEIPGAYKDIDRVMENQKDLVEIVATLKQVLCVKG